jgi:hypothetical protein
MGTANSWHPDEGSLSAKMGHRCSDGCPGRSRGRRSRSFLPLVIATYTCSRLVFSSVLLCSILLCSTLLWAQAPGSPSEDVNTSSTDTIQPQYSNVNPTRTTESHTHSGNRTEDNRSVQRLGADGQFEPYQDIETTTVQVNATTVRTTTRTFGRDSDGAKTLVQLTEEEKRSLPGGDSSVVLSTSNPDANGNLQLVQRQIEETKTISKGVEETKTTVMLPGGNGDLAPAMKTQERRQQGTDGTIDSRKTTLLPDGNGNWQVGETKQITIHQDGKTRSSEQTVSRSDLDGHLDEVSRTVSKESENAPGQTVKSVETDSLDVPGVTRDGSLHPVEVTTTIGKTTSSGQQTSDQEVERPDPGNPGAGLRVTTITIDTVSPGSSGSHATRSVQALDANDSLGIVSVDTAQSTKSPAVRVQIAPSEKPK